MDCPPAADVSTGPSWFMMAVPIIAGVVLSKIINSSCIQQRNNYIFFARDLHTNKEEITDPKDRGEIIRLCKAAPESIIYNMHLLHNLDRYDLLTIARDLWSLLMSNEGLNFFVASKNKDKTSCTRDRHANEYVLNCANEQLQRRVNVIDKLFGINTLFDSAIKEALNEICNKYPLIRNYEPVASFLSKKS